MKWKKSSPELGKVLEFALSPFTCQKKMMFGAPVYMVNHNMFVGVHEDHIFIRLSEPDRKKIAASYPQAAPFEPMKGRIMKEYMVIPGALYEDTEAFRGWLRRAGEYASSLPPKEQKKRK